MDASTSTDLAQQLSRVARQKRNIRRVQRALVWTPPILVVAHFPLTQVGVELPSVLLWGAIIVLSSVAALAVVVRQRDRDIVEILGTLGDPAAVGPLAEASQLEGMEQTVSVALKQLLPLLKRSDGRLLSPSQRTALFSLVLEDDYNEAPSYLRSRRERNGRAVNTLAHHEHFGLESFRLALLGALKELGDPAALPYVMRVCNSYSTEVRRAARDCLQELQKQAALLEQKQKLLRTPDSNQALLQPASAAAADEELLLHTLDT
jgi:hypothetical protein